jgi:hypothetical protein
MPSWLWFAICGPREKGKIEREEKKYCDFVRAVLLSLCASTNLAVTDFMICVSYFFSVTGVKMLGHTVVIPSVYAIIFVSELDG